MNIDNENRHGDICGEPLDYDNPLIEIGEFYDPDQPLGSRHYICHADCGLSAGYELA